MTDYMLLNESELRIYIKQNPQDNEAFQHYLTLVRAKPNRVVVATEEQFEEELRKRIA